MINIKLNLVVIIVIVFLKSFFTFTVFGQSKKSSPSIVIYGQIVPSVDEQGKKFKSDTITVTLWKTFTANGWKYPKPTSFITTTKLGGQFTGRGQAIFDITIPEVEDLSYIRISSGDELLLNNFLVGQGDSVKILFDKRLRINVFSGPSADKYRCQYEIEVAKETNKFENDVPVFTKNISDFFVNDSSRSRYDDYYKNTFGNKYKVIPMYGKEFFSKLRTDLSIAPNSLPGSNVLNRYKDLVSPHIISILRANLLGNYYNEQFQIYYRSYNFALKDNRTDVIDSLRTIYNELIRDFSSHCFDDNTTIKSSFSNALLMKAHIDSKLQNKSTYQILKNQYEGVLREKLVLSYFTQSIGSLKDGNELMKDALSYIDHGIYADALKEIYNSSRIGAKAYDFELQNSDGNMVRLSDFRGKVIFIDFWFTGCLSCADFFKEHLSKVEEHYKSNPNIIFISISIDKNIVQWKQSINKGLYTSRHATNLFTMGKGGKHPVLEQYAVIGYPSQVLIDRKGHILQRANLNLTSDKLINIINTAIDK